MNAKTRILGEIKRIADTNGGKAPGVRAFKTATGLRTNDWFPHLWLRWGDALMEAGYAPNKLQSAHSKDLVVEKFVAFARELGHIPVKGELLRKAREDKTFPGERALYNEGKEGLLRRAVAYCEARSGFEDVLVLCNAELRDSTVEAAQKQAKVSTGYVYLMRSGKHHKIGRTISLGSRERQLAIKIPVPPTTIHSIETDDPSGIEAYWHRRFADRRGEGEWFLLSPEDIQAFKRWKKIV